MDKMSQGDQPILNGHKITSNFENRAKWLGPFFFQNFPWNQERVPIFPFAKSWMLEWSFILTSKKHVLDQIDLVLYVMSLLIRPSNCYRHTRGDACKGKLGKLFFRLVRRYLQNLGYSKTWGSSCKFTFVPLKSSETGFLMISRGVEVNKFA